MPRFIHVVLVICGIVGCSKDGTQHNKPMHEVNQVTIYYIDWNVDTYRSQSCEDLQRSGDSVLIQQTELVEKLTNAVGSATLIALPEYNDIDARICCVFVDSGYRVLHRLAFAPPPVMKLDEKIYKRDSLLFEVVLSFLPDDYLKDWSPD